MRNESGSIRTSPPPAGELSRSFQGLVWQALAELGVVLAAVAAYYLVRGATQGSEALATAHARQVFHLEQDLGIAWGPRLQSLTEGHEWLEQLLSLIYLWANWPVIAATAFWLFFRHRPYYYVLRNAFLISGAIGLVVFIAYPVAPPRLAGLGFADTVAAHSNAYRVLQPPAFVDQYAAMPSFHFGWALLIGGALFMRSRRWYTRALGPILVVAMLAAVVLTANHFVLDAVAGGVLAVFGLVAAVWLRAQPMPAFCVRILWGDAETAAAPLHMLEPGV